MLQEKLEEPISEPPSPRQFADGEDAVGDLASHITSLREEIRRLKQQLAKSEADCKSSRLTVKLLQLTFKEMYELHWRIDAM